MDEETEQRDQTAASQSATDETNGAPSSTEGQARGDDKAEPTMADVARQAYEESTARSEAQGAAQELGETQEEETSQGEEEAQSGQEQQQEQGEETTEEEDDRLAREKREKEAEGEKPPPFDKHPAWQKRTKEFNEVKQKLTELERALAAEAPQKKNWTSHQQFLKQYGIQEQEVATMMNFLALMRVNPAQARDQLKPLWEQLAQYDSTAMPKELLDAVESGDITKAMAERLWKAECAQLSGRLSGELTAKQIEANKTQAHQDALSSWDMSTRKTDPEFKPKTDEAAPDGLWEITAAKFSYLRAMTPPADAGADVRLLEKAYAEAKKFIKSQRPAPKVNGKVPNSSRSSGQRRPEPKSIDDVVAAEARKHGINWSSRRPNNE
jgi:hypothetical protein